MRRFSAQGAPSMDILGNESLWQNDSMMVEAAAAAGTETTQQAEDSDTVSGCPAETPRQHVAVTLASANVQPCLNSRPSIHHLSLVPT